MPRLPSRFAAVILGFAPLLFQRSWRHAEALLTGAILVKIGAKVVSHGRYVTFQMAEVAVPRRLFAAVLWLIGRLRAPPALA